MNGCAPGLILIERLKATLKWAILNVWLKACFMISILSIFRTLDDIHSPHRSFIQFDPHPPGFCSVPRGFTISPPPIPWNFHDFFNWVPLPLGNFISIDNKTFKSHFNLIGTVIKFSRSYSCFYIVDENSRRHIF